MANEYDISSQVSGYGSPGASAFFGVQQELMRRAQLQQEAEVRAQALERQRQQDDLNNQRIQQEIAASKENTASQTALREANAAKANEALSAGNLKDVTGAFTSGTDLTPEQEAIIVKKIGPDQAALLLGKKPAVAATAGTPGMDLGGAAEPIAAIAGTPAQAAKTTYIGTAAQQEEARKKDAAEATLRGDNDTGNDAIDQLQRVHAAEYLRTGKDISATDAASILKAQAKPEVDPVKTLAQETLKMEKYAADKAQGMPGTPAEDAAYNVWLQRHPTTMDTEKFRANAANAADERTTAHQDQRELFQAKQSFRTRIASEDVKLSDALQRVDRAQRMINTGNFVNDSAEAAEFLQIVAGGMGSGLRMTDAELNRVTSAQSLLAQWKAKWAKAGIGEQVTIGNEMRAQMKTILDEVAAARQRYAKELQDARAHVGDINSQKELDQYESDFMGRKHEANKMGASAAAPSKYKVTVE